MKNIACINAINLTNYAYEKIGGEKSSFTRALEAAREMPGVEKVVLLASGDTMIGELPGKSLKVDERDSWSIADLLDSLDSNSKGYDSVFYFFADCPFIDPGLARDMHSSHVKYFADYSFADGYPYGLAPEIVSQRIIGQLKRLSEKSGPGLSRETIFDIIKKDINSFDVETALSPFDLRFLRISLASDNKRNFMLIERLAGLLRNEKGEKKDADSATIIKTIQEHPEILRTLPSFYSVQVAEKCPYACSYCPYPKINPNLVAGTSEIDPSRFGLILDKIEKFSEDAYVDISLWGDPAFHSQAGSLIAEACNRKGIELVIETSGIGWKHETLKSISRLSKKYPTWIVSLDACKRDYYEKLRGKGFEEASQTVELLMKIFPGRVYVQAVRMKENEEDVEDFYKQWKAKTDNLVIQKYDHFCGFLEEKKVSDLTPVKRMPCWHLKRDVSILMDGTVALCKEDIQRKVLLGNIFTDDIEEIWGRGESFYLDHVKESYIEICKLCDEYYTFNF